MVRSQSNFQKWSWKWCNYWRIDVCVYVAQVFFFPKIVRTWRTLGIFFPLAQVQRLCTAVASPDIGQTIGRKKFKYFRFCLVSIYWEINFYDKEYCLEKIYIFFSFLPSCYPIWCAIMILGALQFSISFDEIGETFSRNGTKKARLTEERERKRAFRC